MKIAEVTRLIEEMAPLGLQEGWDNCGLQVGDANAEATGALLCLDVTEAILDEAIAKAASLIKEYIKDYGSFSIENDINDLSFLGNSRLLRWFL